MACCNSSEWLLPRKRPLDDQSTKSQPARAAQGITDSFRDAELLAEAIDAGFSWHRLLEEALAEYERQRNEAAMPNYELTCQFATLGPPAPEMQRLFAALLENQE